MGKAFNGGLIVLIAVAYFWVTNTAKNCMCARGASPNLLSVLANCYDKTSAASCVIACKAVGNDVGAELWKKCL